MTAQPNPARLSSPQRRRGAAVRVARGGVILAVGLLLAACERPVPAPPGPTAVRLETVGERATVKNVTLPASVTARTESQLGMRVGGRLVSRPVDVGATVKQGSVLAALDPAPLRLSVQAAEAQLLQTRSAQAQATSDVARNRQLVERGAIAKADFQRLETAATTAQAQVRAADSQLQRARTDLDDATLRAPSNGIVTAVLAEPGQVVAAGTPILTLAYAGELEVQVDLPEHLVNAIGVGSSARVALLEQPDASLPATVREVSPAADPVTRTYRTRLVVPGLEKTARLGMSATVNLEPTPAAGSKVWRLPLSALLQQDGRTAVWVLPEGKDQLELRAVTVERMGSNDITISDGLAAGERVVTAGVHRLDPGMKVKPWDGKLP